MGIAVADFKTEYLKCYRHNENLLCQLDEVY